MLKPSTTINYQTILKKYLFGVLETQGSTFIDAITEHGWWSEPETRIMLKLKSEAEAELQKRKSG